MISDLSICAKDRSLPGMCTDSCHRYGTRRTPVLTYKLVDFVNTLKC